jgi:CheY-like chemotaxis protein
MDNIKVLIVDDIPQNRLLLTEIVSDLGHAYAEACDGKEAIEYLKNHHCDLIFMDLNMPVLNGVEATKRIRSWKPYSWKNDIPIIAITAYNPQEFFKNYYDVGFNHLISKPYTPDKIEKVLNYFIESDFF